MQTTLSVQTESEAGSKVHSFELDSTDLAFIPNVGDEIELPGMGTSVKITGRSFAYSSPNALQVWLNYDLEELE